MFLVNNNEIISLILSVENYRGDHRFYNAECTTGIFYPEKWKLSSVLKVVVKLLFFKMTQTIFILHWFGKRECFNKTVLNRTFYFIISVKFEGS